MESSQQGTSPHWFIRHRVVALVAVNAVLMALVAGGLELAYRAQIVDFWIADLHRANPDVRSHDSRPTMLVLGDSFTVGRDCFADRLRSRLGDGVRIVNSGVSGTTAREAAMMAPRRLSQFHPQLVIHQLYVGNDLLETLHAPELGRIGVGRRLYWTLLDRGWWSLGWVNYKLGQLRSRMVADPEDAEVGHQRERRDAAASFDPARYRDRDRALLAADHRVVTGQIEVSGPWARVWPVYRQSLRDVEEAVRAAGARLVVVVVPHCIQVDPVYRERFRELGADVSAEVDLGQSPSPFVELVRNAMPGVTVVDPLPSMQAAERMGVRLYRTHDPHLRTLGQDLMVEVVIRDGLASGSFGVRPSP